MFFPGHFICCPPSVRILTALLAASILLAYTLMRDGLPRFEDPVIGFEPRYTPLANRLNSWRLLHESTAWNGPLSLYPRLRNDSEHSVATGISSSSKNETKIKPKKPRNRKKSKSKTFKTNSTETANQVFGGKNHGIPDSFFCGKIVEDYVHFVVESTNGHSLLELDSLRNLCRLDRDVLRQEPDSSCNNRTMESSMSGRFCHYCEVKNLTECCPSWSVANYVLLLANKTAGDCDSLTADDVSRFVQLLRDCSPYYAGQYLSEDCLPEPDVPTSICPNMPTECVGHENLVFNVFHYLVDYRFLGMREKILSPESLSYQNQTNELEPFLLATSIFLPMAKSINLMTYYESTITSSKLRRHQSTTSALTYGNVRVVAADLGLKYALFNKLVVVDLILPCTACFIILISLILFTRSILLTTMALLTNVASLAAAYFLYTHLFGISFFPFLNLLSLIILVAIGSDNALIFCKVWSCCRQTAAATDRRRADYETELAAALRHVLVSAFCASFTTGGAFLAGYFSNITSLKCFSIFSALSIVANFIITAVTFPAAIILSDRLTGTDTAGAAKVSTAPTWRWLESVVRWWSSTDCFLQYFFDKIILKLVFNHHQILVATLSIISVVSATIVLYRPGLRLPESQEFQLFSSQHLFERYDLVHKNLFWFSRVEKTSQQQQPDSSPSLATGQSNLVLPIRVVFGILPEDTGDSLNPFDRGVLHFDPAFNISSERSQVWLLEFCREIRAQTFYKSTLGPMLTNCFIETFQSWMETRKCREVVGDQIYDHYPCCELTRFPYEPAVFDQCLAELIERLHRTSNFIYQAHQAGPRFNATTGRIKAFVVEYDSIYDALTTTTGSYNQTRNVWTGLNRWIDQRLEMAPPGLRRGWLVTTNLEFYALQQSLSTGVVRSLFIAVLFAFVTLVSTTRNLRLSLLSITTIAGVIFTSVAILVLLGWRLNIIESMVISLTIGLSIDATLHYTIAYKMLTKGNRLLGIQMTVARVGSPVAMGALTTFVAGAVMLMSQVLAYIQIGAFLMAISGVSLIYSTLFHLSLLILFGSDDPGRSISTSSQTSTSSPWSIIKSLVPKRVWRRKPATMVDQQRQPTLVTPDNNNRDNGDLMYDGGTDYGTLATTVGRNGGGSIRSSQDLMVCYHVTSI